VSLLLWLGSCRTACVVPRQGGRCIVVLWCWLLRWSDEAGGMAGCIGGSMLLLCWMNVID
jgi:hypothetical protein